MRRKRLVLAGLGFLTLSVGLLASPRILRAYVERTYPYVKVGRIELGWPVRFYDVKVRKDWLQADLREVRATPRREDVVQILGGTVHVTRKKGEGNKLPQEDALRRRIVAQDLQVTVEREGDRIELEGASINEKYQFEKGTATYQGHTLKLGSGSATKDFREVTLTFAEAEVELPFELPRVAPKSLLRAEHVKVNAVENEAEVEEVSYGPVKAKHIEVHRLGSTIVGKVAVVEVNHPWVSVDPVSFHEVGFSVPWPIAEADFTIGKVRIQTEPKKYRILGAAPCGDWLSALPQPLPDALKGPPENWRGQLAFEVQAKGKAKINVNFDCKYTCSAEPIKTLRSGKFTYSAYNSKGEQFERTIGRNITGWTNIQDIPDHVTKAFITLEDPGFLNHRGIIVQALQNSLTDNLRLGEFFRGGSTITQQLAKNLWLRRHKTISRKVYEALLALALESCLSKEAILELYLNVVEFGPDLYGIGPASKHYFDKEVGDLLPEEAFYLAALLPHPSRAVPPNQGGLEASRKLMKMLITSGFLPDSYLLDAQADSSEWQTND